MKKVALGNTGISIFPLQANLTPGAGGRLIRHALEQGVNMLDTATMYGSYPHIREGLKGWTRPVTVVTKTHAVDAATARAHVETGLKELGAERLDIVHIHAARIADPFSDRAAVLEELLRQKQAGKIAHIGLSSHYIAAFRKALNHPEIEVIHPLINKTGMGILDGTAAEMAEAIEASAAAGKGVYAMKALAGGNLISEARSAIGYVLGLKGVHGIALGMLSETEIDANITLFENGVADDAVWEKLESRRRRLQIMTNFCKGCERCVEICGSSALTMQDGKPVVDEASCILCGYCAEGCPEFIIRVV
jgi:predicted aldo/keto reductase-like oxidoreductase